MSFRVDESSYFTWRVLSPVTDAMTTTCCNRSAVVKGGDILGSELRRVWTLRFIIIGMTGDHILNNGQYMTAGHGKMHISFMIDCQEII